MPDPRERPVYLHAGDHDALLAGLLLLTQEVASLERRVRELEARELAGAEPGVVERLSDLLTREIRGARQ